MRCDQLGRVAATHSRMMVAEIYSKLTEYLENALISRQETPTIQLRLTRALHFRDDKSVVSLVQNVIGGVISVAENTYMDKCSRPALPRKPSRSARLAITCRKSPSIMRFDQFWSC